MPRKILLADDSVTIQKVIAITFANEDYELVVAADGAEALQKAREIQPDLVMVDVAMPGKNGYDVCAEIKKDSALSGTPVMLLAGTFEPLDEGRASSAGADDHIVKPFESKDLLEKVRALVGKGGAAPATETAAATTEKPGDEWNKPASDEIWGEGDFLDFNEEFGDRTAAVESADVASALPVPAEAEGELPTFDTAFGDQDTTAAGGDEFSSAPETDFVDMDFSEDELKSTEAPIEEAASTDAPDELSGWRSEAPTTTEEEPAESDSGFFGGTSFGGSFWGEEEAEVETPSVETAEVEPTEAAATEEPSVPGFDTGFFGVTPDEIAASPEPEAEAKGFEPETFGIPAEEPVFESPEAVPSAGGLGEATLEAAIPAVEERAAEEVLQRLAGMDLPKETVEEIVKKVAREVIEEVAWEVVPELAEELINNELVKVREAFSKLKS